MFSKKHRLTGKQIHFLLGRAKKIYGTTLVLLAYPQRTNFPHTQRSIHIPVKVDKRATMRNLLKRKAKEFFMQGRMQQGADSSRQLFLFVNKNAVERTKELIANKEKTTIVQHRQRLCQQDFELFYRHLFPGGKHDGLRSLPGDLPK